MLNITHFLQQLTRMLASAVFILFPIIIFAQDGTHPYVFLGNDNIPPMIYMQDSKPAGLVVDLTHALAEKSELNIRVETMDWSKAQEIVSKGQADALLQINKNNEREKIYAFSKPLLESHFCIFRSDSRMDIRNIRSLSGKTVGVENKGYPHSLVKKYPDIKIKIISSWKEGFDLINDEQIDAVIVDRWVGEYGLSNHGIKGITAVDQPVEIRYSHIAVKKGNRRLLERINEGMKQIHEDGTYNKILDQWTKKEVVYMSKKQYNSYRRSLKQAVVDADKPQGVSLTPEEQTWLEAHPAITMCVDPAWMPFERINKEGKYDGMLADYMSFISSSLGITFELYPTKTYKESLSNLAAGNCTIVSSGASDKETIRQSLATKAYFHSPRVFAVHQDTPFVSDFHKIVDRRIGVVATYPIRDELPKLYPNINLVLVENQAEGVRKVSSGEIDAFVSTLGGISYSIQQYSLSNVKIGGVYPGGAPINILVNQNETALTPILNKAIDSITQADRKRIANRWISVKFERGFNYDLVWKISFGFLLVLVVVLVWNYIIRQQKLALAESESRLRKARDDAEAANKAKSMFLTNMSHELRTPLNAIMGFSEMIGRSHDTPAAIQEKAAIINRSGGHLLAMINDVLHISKIETSRIDLEPESINLPQMLLDIGSIFEVRAENTGLNFNLELDPNLTQYVRTDTGKLRQILINLLGNAVKFTGEGDFSLRARTRPIEGNPSMVSLQLEVKDNGPGIAPEYLNHIFQPFVQVEYSELNEKGVGLGLAICKSFVDLMGGEISIESTVGKGSLFKVDLPMNIAEASEIINKETKPVVQRLEPGQTEWRILVVEDNRENRLLLRSQLENVGFLVEEAKNGKEAVTLFKQWQPHFIWMNIRMPVMDGYQATERIRSLPGGDKVKIVAITAGTFKEQRKKISAAGCDDLVHKPFQEWEVFEAMKKQLGVKFIYKNEVNSKKEAKIQKLSREMLVSLPAEILKELRQAALEGDGEKARELAESISESHLETARAIKNITNEYQLHNVLNLLDEE